MKSRTAGLGAVLALALTAHLAQGAMVLNAPFNNSSVWTVATSAGTGQTVLGSLSNVYLGYTFNGMTVSSGGGSNLSTLQVQNPNSSGTAHQYNVAYASLGSAISGGAPSDVWVSFLFRYSDTETSMVNGQLGIFWLDANNTDSHTEKMGFGFDVQSHAGTGEAQLPNGLAPPDNATNKDWGGSLNSGTTYFIVADLGGLSGGNYTTLKVWIDPTSTNLGSPTVSETGSVAASKLSDVGIRATVNFKDTLYFGNPIVATTEGEVLPTPEPPVFALTGIGLLGLSLLLRRKAA
jgi:hypothetical protein